MTCEIDVRSGWDSELYYRWLRQMFYRQGSPRNGSEMATRREMLSRLRRSGGMRGQQTFACGRGV